MFASRSKLAVISVLAAATGCAEMSGPALDAREQAIVGGGQTDAYPAVPLLYYEEQDGSWFTCSGTLISPYVVVTAAHCVDEPGNPAQHLAYFGGNTLLDSLEADPAYLGMVAALDRAYDPAYVDDQPTAGHDIGLVALAEPAPVPPMAYHRAGGALPDDPMIQLVGWGITSATADDAGIKRAVEAAVVDSDARFVRYGDAAANTCPGDSGGPGFLTVDGEERLVTITSFGTNECDEGYGGRIDHYLESLVEPFIAEHDPDGGCLTDGACNQACGEVDADCGGGQPGDGEDDGDGHGDGEGDGEVTYSPSVGGCSSGGAGGPLAIALAGLALALVRRRAATLAVALGAATGCAGLDPDVAGSAAQAIVGGRPTDGYPAAPLLLLETPSGAELTCSSALIAPQVVVTAAHCALLLPATPTRVYFGSSALTERLEDDPGFVAVIDAVDWAYDPAYDLERSHLGHDFALVTLAEPAPMAPLPYHRERGPMPDEDPTVHLVGWGDTEAAAGEAGVKREVDADLIESDDLFLAYGDDEASTCHGDSGGPGFLTIDGQERLVTITSYGAPGCGLGHGGRIDAYLDSFIDPYIAAQDPSGGCLVDGACNDLCGVADPDCAPPGVGEPDGHSEDDGVGDSDVRPSSGGCAAGGRLGPLGLSLALTGLALSRRRRAT